MKLRGSLRMRPSESGLRLNQTEINRRSQIAQNEAAQGTSSTDNETKPESREEITRLTKLFPIEGVALLPPAIAIANGVEGATKTDNTAGLPSEWTLLGLTLVIALAIWLIRNIATKDEDGKPLSKAVWISVAAFLIYAFSLGSFDAFLWFLGEWKEALRGSIGSFIAIIFTWALQSFDQALPNEGN